MARGWWWGNFSKNLGNAVKEELRVVGNVPGHSFRQVGETEGTNSGEDRPGQSICSGELALERSPDTAGPEMHLDALGAIQVNDPGGAGSVKQQEQVQEVPLAKPAGHSDGGLSQVTIRAGRGIGWHRGLRWPNGTEVRRKSSAVGSQVLKLREWPEGVEVTWAYSSGICCQASRRLAMMGSSLPISTPSFLRLASTMLVIRKT